MLDFIRTGIARAIAPPRVRLALTAAEGMVINFMSPRGDPPRRGTKELLRAYSTMPWLHAVTNKVGQAVAQTAWQLFVIRQGGNGRAILPGKIQRANFGVRAKLLDAAMKAGELVEIDEHPLLTMLNSGNDMFSGIVAFQLTQNHLDLAGEGIWILERNGVGMPVGYWPVPPDWVRTTPSRNSDFFTIVIGSTQHEVPAGEIIWFKDPDPANPYGRGVGTARVLGDELETDEHTARFLRTFFINRARPDLIITAEGLKPEETARMEERWLDKHEGFWKQFKPHFLSRKVDIKELGQSFEQLQLVKLREFERNTIHQVFGVPPEILGIIENSNRATSDAADFIFTSWVVVPRIELLRNTMQFTLVPQFDERLILTYESPVGADEAAELKAMVAAPWAATLDEWRAKQGLREKTDDQGDVHMMPLNLIPVRDPSAGAGPAEPEPVLPALGQVGAQRLIAFMDNLRGGQRPFGDARPLPHPGGPRRPIYKALSDADINAIVDAVGDGRIRIKTWTVVEDALAETVSLVGAATLEDIGAELAFVETERIAEFVRRWGLERATLIDDTTAALLRESLAEGISGRETLDQLVARVADLYEGARDVRATTIARTETTRAANFGAQEALRQANVEVREWLSTRDPFVRAEHLELDGQTAALEMPFMVPSGPHAGAGAMFPGDFGVAALDINCRCTVVARPEGERSVYDTEEKRVARWKLFESIRLPQERALRRAVQRAFRIQQAEIEDILRDRFVQ